MPELAWFDFDLDSLKIVLMTVWLLCLFSSHRVYNCTYYCCSTSCVFAFLKIWEVFASSLLWSHENITSPLRTWGLLYVINSITTEKKRHLFVILFAEENICDSWQQNENYRLKLFCSALCDPGHFPCLDEAILHNLPSTHQLSCSEQWPSSAPKESGCPQKNKHMGSSCAPLSSE